MSDRLPENPPFERYNLLNDVLFGKLFGEKGDEPQLLAFLKPILARTERELESIEILGTVRQTPETFGGKISILDIRAQMKDGTYCNIEVQRQNQYNMERRSLYYWAKEFSAHILSGQNYKELPDVIAINLLDFTYLPLEDFHTSFHLWEDHYKEHKLINAIEIHFIELPKFRRLPQKNIHENLLHRWLSFLDVESPIPLIEEIAKMDPVIARTKEMSERFIQDDEIRHAYLLQEMALSDETSRLEGALEEQRNKLLSLMRQGYTPEQIEAMLTSRE